MDFSNANTEPYRQFHDFHENLNSNIKILATSLTYLMKNVNDIEFNKALKETDESWKFSPIYSIEKITDKEIKTNVSTLGIVSCFSAFDDLINGIESEISRWNTKLKIDKQLLPLDKYLSSDEKIINFYNKYAWSTKNIDKLLIVLKYFRLIRDSIVHRNSRISNALSELSKSEVFNESYLKYFHKKNKDKFPEFDYDEVVLLEPRLVFVCSNLLRTIALDLNQKLIAHLGEDGLLNMIVHHVFNKHTTIDTPSYTKPEAVLNNILQNRYRIQMESNKEIILKLKELDLWKICIKQHEVKYKK